MAGAGVVIAAINIVLCAFNAGLAAWNLSTGHPFVGAINAGAAVICGLVAIVAVTS